MQTIRKSLVLVALIGAMIFPATTWAASLSLLGAATYSQPYLTGMGNTPTADFGYPGGGLFVDFRTGRIVHFEIGGVYLARTYKDPSASGGQVTSNNVMGIAQFPIHLSRVLHLLVGGFYNYQLSGGYYANSSANPSDYGPLGGLSLNFPLGRMVALRIDGTYNYGLNNQSTQAGKTITNSYVNGFIGFSFGGM